MFGVQGLRQRKGERARPHSVLNLRATGRLKVSPIWLLGSIYLREDPKELAGSESR